MYIDINSKGVTLNSRYKVEQLVKDGATIVEKPKWQENLILVIVNPTYDIAIYCESEEIFNVLRKEERSGFCTWLVHPDAKLLAGVKD